MSTTEDKNIEEANKKLMTLQDFDLLHSPVHDSRHVSQINRFKLPIPMGRISTKSFIFMTRPNLNLFATKTDTSTKYEVDGNVAINPDLAKLPTYSYIWNLGSDEFNEGTNLGKKIFYSLARYSGISSKTLEIEDTPWLAVISNSATKYAVNGRELDITDVAKTFHGNEIIYGKPTFKHKTAGTISIDFADKRDFSLYYTLKLWVDYIHQVSIGLATPYRKYIIQAILDYAASLYYVVTDETMENIIYWEKLTGVFPLNVPDDMFSYNGDGDRDLNFTINFAYSMRSVQYENHIAELNQQYFITSDDSILNSDDYKYIFAGSAPVAQNSSDYKEIKSFYKGIFNDDTELTQPYGNLTTYPNWIPGTVQHGVPYVHGPYITFGDSTISKVNREASNNKSQFKLRWI